LLLKLHLTTLVTLMTIVNGDFDDVLLTAVLVVPPVPEPKGTPKTLNLGPPLPPTDAAIYP
jgi:hypothetical protein